MFADLLRTPHTPCLEEVLVAPRAGEVARFPSVVHSEQRQVVAFRLVELRLLGVCLALFPLRAIEDALHRQHRDDGQNLLRAPELDRGDQHLREGWLHGEVRHLATKVRQQALAIQGGERIQRLQRRDHGRRRGRVDEVEAEQVIDAHRLEHQDRVRYIRPLDFGDGVW